MAEVGDTAALDTGTECASVRDCDGDGYEAVGVGGDDCDDGDAATHPGAAEGCGDLRDDDCDGATDEGCEAEGLPDPGGLAWICGVESPAVGLVLLVSAAVALLRRGPRPA
ncbi:MAG: MopE-related protein [Myxococcota bacterium]